MTPHILSIERRSHGLRWGLGVLVVTAVAAGILYGYGLGDIGPQTTVLGKPSRVPQIMAAGKDEPPPALTPTAPTVHATALPAPTPIKMSKSRMFDALKTGTVSEKFRAYKLVHDCLEAPLTVSIGAQAGIILQPPDPEICGDLQPGQIAASVRMPLLIEAAKAGVKGAYLALAVNEASGLFSDSGAAYITEAIKKEARASALEHADPTVLFAESEKLAASSKPEDQVLALTRHTAYLIGRWQGTPNEGNPLADPLLNPLNQRLMATMTPEVANAAIAEGRELAKKIIR